ncbi:MAG: M20/M25/M40 family metallo-hydrolase [Chitinispirillia bacterium]|nr:M20/M25/M40 family metallo-hydrolase [Chitinispirillia bacterium]MCL2267682.1 M20/M25/M40 family metallo-hydrolase [Chitinispirillia bacterium]
MDIKRKLSFLISLVSILLLLASCSDNSAVDCCGRPDVSGGKTPFEYFAEISSIPRCTYNEKAASDHLVAFAASLGLEAYQDGIFNVLIKKGGTRGREGEPPVILQAHIDMDCTSAEGVDHDFERDPIIPVITDGDRIAAQKRTTLGADNGSGVSMIMAVLASSNISHPPIEALFVTQEEVGLLGAAYFDVSRLAGRRFINLDSVAEGELIASSAGRVTSEMTIPVDAAIPPDDLVTYNVTVTGPWDAIVAVGWILEALDWEEFYLFGVEGTPKECVAAISFDASDINTLREIIFRVEARFRERIPEDMEIAVTMEEAAAPQIAMSGESARRVVAGILKMPNGLLAEGSYLDGHFRTINNFSAIATVDGEVTISNGASSNLAGGLEWLADELNALAELTGANMEIVSRYPGWPYKPYSPLRDRMAEIFKDVYGRDPLIKATAGGLDCAEFAKSMPDADMVSIGPDIKDIHTPDESMSLSSYNRVYDYLVRVLKEL